MKLKQFPLSLMTDTVQFRDKIISTATTEISDKKCSLKRNTNQEQFEAIQSKIKNNEEAARTLLEQQKFKKLNTLQYKPNSITQPLI